MLENYSAKRVVLPKSRKDACIDWRTGEKVMINGENGANGDWRQGGSLKIISTKLKVEVRTLPIGKGID